MSKNNSNAMSFKGNFPSCTNLKNFNSLSFFPTSESLSRTSWKTSTTEASSFGSTSILPILSSRLKKETFCRSAVRFPSSLVKKLRRIGVETRLKGYKYFEIERDFSNKLGVLIDGDFKFGVLLLVFCSFHWRCYRQSISKCFFVKSQCQSPFPFSLESWHLLKVDRE